jgi:glycine cleavage system H protein
MSFCRAECKNASGGKKDLTGKVSESEELHVSETPENLYYASSHEWLKPGEDGVATVGISDYAQNELGDVVFVELPDVNSQVSARDEISVVESVKTASDIYAPVSGEIIAVNSLLEESPETINSSPYDDGWIIKIRMSNEEELKELLSAEDYRESHDA